MEMNQSTVPTANKPMHIGISGIWEYVTILDPRIAFIFHTSIYSPSEIIFTDDQHD